jgi:hypothetical protein
MGSEIPCQFNQKRGPTICAKWDTSQNQGGANQAAPFKRGNRRSVPQRRLLRSKNPFLNFGTLRIDAIESSDPNS